VKLDAAALGDGGNTGSEAAREPGKNDLHRSRRVVLGREDLRMIGFHAEILVAGLLGAEAEEVADHGAAVRSGHPFAACAPLELGGLGRLLERLAGTQQRIDVDAVVDLRGVRICRLGHSLSPGC
jgi:hypothetical protein